MASIIKRRRKKIQHKLKMTSYSDSTMHSSSGSSQKSLNENVTNFQNAMKILLTGSDRDQMTDILGYYHQSRNVYHLVTSLETVLDTPVKRKLLPMLRQVLPKADREQFDRHTSLQSQTLNGGNMLSTDDSGIGSNTATLRSSARNAKKPATRKSTKTQAVNKGGYYQETSQSSSNKSSSFGSAVRRKVKTAMQQRARSLERLNVPVPKRRHSFTTTLDDPEPVHFSELNTKQSLTVPRTRGKISPYWPRDAYDDVKVVFLKKRTKNETMGFSIRGGAEHNLGIYISHVEMGSAADDSGLLLGDQILRVNNIPFLSDTTHEEAVQTLADATGKLVLYVRSVGQVPDTIVTSHNFSWTDPYGRPTSPPAESIYGMKTKGRRGDLRLLLTDERRVNLTVNPGQRLGLMIRGGTEYGLGIYITGVDPGSASEQAGLKAGDQILEVNNVNFTTISHANAVNVIRSSRILMMMLRHVGRIPQCHISEEETKWMSDEQISFHSLKTSRSGSLHRRPGSALGVFQRGLAGSDQVTLQHAQSSSSLSLSSLERSLCQIMSEVEEPGLLADEELNTTRYYINEYVLGHVSVDSLVLSLGELLDTHEKFALMSSIRRCLFNRDVDRFDVLVLRREVEALKHQHDVDRMNINRSHRREHTRKSRDDIPKARSRSAPPHKSATVELTRSSSFESSNEPAETYISPPHASSTPNTSRELPNESPLHSTPRIMSATTSTSESRTRRTLSPIFKNTSAVLPTPMKLLPPAKPKRTSMQPTSYEERLHSKEENTKLNCTTAITADQSTSTQDPIYSKICRITPKRPPDNPVLSSVKAVESREKNRASNLATNVQRASSFKTVDTNSIYSTVSATQSQPENLYDRTYTKKDNFRGPIFNNAQSLHIKNQNTYRTPSPFTVALEKHKASTKAGGSSQTFFNNPQRNITTPATNTVVSTATSTSVHRICNNIHIIESADSESDFTEENLPPPPMSFLHNTSPALRRFPVKADVHKPPGLQDRPGYMSLPFESKNFDKSTTMASQSCLNAAHNNNNSNSSTAALHQNQAMSSFESYDENEIEYEDFIDPSQYLKDVEKQKVIIFKIAPTLGMSVEGGANTKQPLPRISDVQAGGCAYMCGRVEPGHVIHQVNGIDMAGMEHGEIAKTIAMAFKTKGRDSIELLISGPHENVS